MEVSQGDLRAKSRVFNFDVCLQWQDVDSTPIKKPRLTLSDRPLHRSTVLIYHILSQDKKKTLFRHAFLAYLRNCLFLIT